MHNTNKIFVVFGIILLVLGGALGYAYYVQYELYLELDQTKLKFISLSNDLQETKDIYDQKLLTLEDTFNAALTSKAAQLENAIKSSEVTQSKKITGLSTDLDQLQAESDTKFGELKSQILDINVKTDSFTSIIEDVIKGVVIIKTTKGVGSGIIADEEGFIITNHHVIDGITKAPVIITSEGEKYSGQILSYHVGADLAVLKINAGKKLYDLRIEDFDKVKVGQKVIALGSPLGLDFTVTEGIVSSITRKNSAGYSLIQTDVSINPGNSGGPLINANGRVIGINTFKAEDSEGIGFAMNPTTIKTMLEETIDLYNDAVKE